MNNILLHFKISYHKDSTPVMYTKHKNNRYAKTYLNMGIVKSEYIDIHEFASALAHIILTS